MFDFKEYLLKVTNQDLIPLQGNVRYEDLVGGIASAFEKLYNRAQEIKINETLNKDSNTDFQKYLNNNDGEVQEDIFLNYTAHYLNTDHFKETLTLMMKLWQRREPEGIEDEKSFIENHIIPAFKFYTINSAALHKSKGINVLFRKLFEFYSTVEDDTAAFDGVFETEIEDERNRRLEAFTSIRNVAEEPLVIENYTDDVLGAGSFDILKSFECNTHKYVLLQAETNILFISRKDRENWHIVTTANDVYRINDYSYAVVDDGMLFVYKDTVEIYDENYEYVAPTSQTITEVFDNSVSTVFDSIVKDYTDNINAVPKIINLNDTDNEIYTDVLYFVILEEDNSYDVKRIRHDKDLDIFFEEIVKSDIQLSNHPFDDDIIPDIELIRPIDYMWIDIDPVSFGSWREDDVQLVYSYVIDYKTETETKHYACVSMEGYDHQPEGMYFNPATEIDAAAIDKYVLQERVLEDKLKETLDEQYNIEDAEFKTVFDLVIPASYDLGLDSSRFNEQGEWDASIGTPPSDSPNHGDWWKVTVGGDAPYGNMNYWNVNDVIHWDANIGEWTKNNDILKIYNITDDNKTFYILKRKLIGLMDTLDQGSTINEHISLHNFDLSNLELNINSLEDIISVDSNSFYKFGENPTITFLYKDKNYVEKYVVINLFGDKYYTTVNNIDLNKILKNYPKDNSKLVPYKLEINDKNLLVYSNDATFPELKSMCTCIANFTYNLQYGFIGSESYLYYDANTNLSTRSRQKYFRDRIYYRYIEQRPANLEATPTYDGTDIVYYEDWEDEGVITTLLEDEEIDTFKKLMRIYKPINVASDAIVANIDIAKEEIDEEILDRNIHDKLEITISENPEEIDVEGYEFPETITIKNFDEMKPEFIIGDTGDIQELELTYVGEYNDEYSNFDDCYRWESEMVTFTDYSETIPVDNFFVVRLNLTKYIQKETPYGSNSKLEYNWMMSFEYLEYDLASTSFDIAATIPEIIQTDLRYIYKELDDDNRLNHEGHYWASGYDDEATITDLPTITREHSISNLNVFKDTEKWNVFKKEFPFHGVTVDLYDCTIDSVEFEVSKLDNTSDAEYVVAVYETNGYYPSGAAIAYSDIVESRCFDLYPEKCMTIFPFSIPLELTEGKYAFILYNRNEDNENNKEIIWGRLLKEPMYNPMTFIYNDSGNGDTWLNNPIGDVSENNDYWTEYKFNINGDSLYSSLDPIGQDDIGSEIYNIYNTLGCDVGDIDEPVASTYENTCWEGCQDIGSTIPSTIPESPSTIPEVEGVVLLMHFDS